MPAGGYKIGTIILKSDVHIFLENGATLYGSTDIKNYRPMKSDYVSLRTQHNTLQLIYADKVRNVTIEGLGTIDGQGGVFKKTTMEEAGILRPHLIRFIQSENILLRDITLRNSGCWMQHYLACDGVRIEDVTVFNRDNYNNDALDLDCCRDVVVKGMIADTDDDGLTLKSTADRPCENIRISDCIVSSHCNAVKMGTESNGGFRNISISSIVVKPSCNQEKKLYGLTRGISAISLEIVDGGVMENVNISDFTIEGTESPIFIRLGNRGRGYRFSSPDDDPTDFTHLVPVDTVGRINGIQLSNILVHGAGATGCSITGLPGHPVENIWLSNISIQQKGGITETELPKISERIKNEMEKDYPEATMWGCLPAKGFFVRHARNVQFHNVQILTEEADVRPDFLCDDVE
ncbi:MAG: glycoside hydrolase [Bacteroidaceae bacterium]|nr:glycoside hydrolase [Bacteroidaceae bacterium]